MSGYDFGLFVLGGLLTVFGLWVILANWTVFWIGRVLKRRCGSWTPLLGGVSLSVGFALIPGNPYRWLWWAPFLLDWGSAPGIAHSLFRIWSGNRKGAARDR